MCTDLFEDQAGSSAAEMALVAPFLIILMFGAFELGNYFLSEHVVVKAVRDGARYAGRLSFSNYSCPNASTGNIPGGNVVNDTRNIVRTGQIADNGSPRLNRWTNPASINVTYDCLDPTSVSPSYTGIYEGMDFVPVVKVEIVTNGNNRLKYQSLFNDIGLASSSLYLNARSQAAVMGL